MAVFTDAPSAAVLTALPGLEIDPTAVAEVIEAADPVQAGIEHAVREARQLLAVPGVAGVNLSGMASARGVQVAAEIQAEIGRRVRSEQRAVNASMQAEFDTVAGWTADVALDLGPDHHLPAACRGSGRPSALRWLLERLAPSPGDRMLDCGAGVGGPSAFARAETGIVPTLSDPEYGACRAAQRLFGLPVVQARAPLPFATRGVRPGLEPGGAVHRPRPGRLPGRAGPGAASRPAGSACWSSSRPGRSASSRRATTS